MYHCVIHQENLAAQILKMNHECDASIVRVVSAINFIRSKALNHRKFKVMLEKLEFDFKDVTYYCKIRWLSGIKNLHIFYNLLNKIDVFMQSKGHEHPEFTDKHWISDLAFLVDISEHMSK